VVSSVHRPKKFLEVGSFFALRPAVKRTGAVHVNRLDTAAQGGHPKMAEQRAALNAHHVALATQGLQVRPYEGRSRYKSISTS
jgi:hypothetical protein